MMAPTFSSVAWEGDELGARPIIFESIRLEAIREQGRGKIQCWRCGGWYTPGKYPQHIRSVPLSDPRHALDRPIHVAVDGTVSYG